MDWTISGAQDCELLHTQDRFIEMARELECVRKVDCDYRLQGMGHGKESDGFFDGLGSPFGSKAETEMIVRPDESWLMLLCHTEYSRCAIIFANLPQSAADHH